MTQVLPSRTVELLCDELKSGIKKGKFAEGLLLPSIRDIAKNYGYSTKVVHQSLQHLSSLGLLAAEDKKGYRVINQSTNPIETIVFLMGSHLPIHASSTYQLIVNCLHDEVRRLGKSMHIMESQGFLPNTIVEQIKTLNASGIVLERCEQDLVEMLMTLNIPLIFIDSWSENLSVDSVTQDGQLGAIQAVKYLHDKGFTEIAWFGREIQETHSADRFSGYMAEMHRLQINLNPQLILQVNEENEYQKAKELLRKKPQAIICLWRQWAAVIQDVALELGLEIGKDFELVTWCQKREYEVLSKITFKNNPPPTIIWDTSDMIANALSRLQERRANPKLSVIRIKVPTQLIPRNNTSQKPN